MQAHELYDVIIIGGPTECFHLLCRYAIKSKNIETLPVLGGQIEVMYPKKIFLTSGYPLH